MPRSVYSAVGRGGPSRFNPINLGKRFTVGAVAVAIAMLGTATVASAATSVGTVTFASANLRAGATASWTAGFTPATTVSAGTAGHVVVTFPFAVPTSPTVTTSGMGTCATGGTGVTASGSADTVTLAWTTASACSLTATTAATVVIAGITNPAVGSYAASGFTVYTSADTAPAALTSGNPVFIYEAALAAPSATNTGNGTASVSYVTDGSPSAVTTTYTLSVSPSAGTSITGTHCAAYTNADTAGTPTTQTCDVTGLTPGTAYTYTVTETPTGSYTAANAGVSSPLVASTAMGTPVATVFGSGSAMVTFTSDGAADLYTVTSSPAGGTCAIGGTPVAAGSVSCLVTGLTNGTSYTFTVTPSGGTTTSTVSAPSNAVVPGPILATPTAALAGSGQVNISFTADGVATLYTVSATATGHATEVCYVSNGSTPVKGSQNCTVTGLANGVQYTFTVTPSGNGTVTLPKSTTATPLANTMSAPTVALAGYGAVNVTFAADGVATTYLVTSNTGSFVCTVYNATPPVGLQSCTVTGLANNTAYTFTVAPNGNGTTTGTSAASASITTSSALATPTATAAGPGAAKVTFTADGVATVYTVASNPAVAGATCQVVNTTTPPTGSQSCTVTGLTGGVAYTFTVTPAGNGMTSTVSAASNAVVVQVGLAAPVAAGVGSGLINVSFTADGVASTYVVTSTPGSLTCTVTNPTTAPTGSQNCTVTGLTNGTSYTFTVTASGNGSTSGTSPASNAVVAGASLATPTVATAGYGAINVSFTADGVSALYTVQAYTAAAPTTPVVGATCFVGNTSTPLTGAQSCTVKGLSNGTLYVFDVTPSGNSTSSSMSAKSAQIAPTAALATPTVANAGSGAITVSFVADGVASTYVVTSTPSVAGAMCVVANTVTPPTGAQKCTVSGLTNGVPYTFTVTPSGNSSQSGPSTSSAIMAGVSFLAAPTVSWAASGSVLVTFAADGVASTYVVQSATAVAPAGVTPTQGTCTVANSTTAPKGTQSCTVTGLTNGVSYTFTVTPSGNATTSLVSAASAPFMVTASVAPAAVTAVTTTTTANSITVGWTAPTNTGNSALTGYMVTATAGNTTISCGTVAGTATSCTITGLSASTVYVVSVAAVNAIGTSAAVTASATTQAAPAAKNPYTSGTHGVAYAGRTVTLTISGGNFYGQPRITSNVAGTRVGVKGDTGSLLTIIVTTPANAPKGWHTFTITLANGKVCRANYDVK